MAKPRSLYMYAPEPTSGTMAKPKSPYAPEPKSGTMAKTKSLYAPEPKSGTMAKPTRARVQQNPKVEQWQNPHGAEQVCKAQLWTHRCTHSRASRSHVKYRFVERYNFVTKWAPLHFLKLKMLVQCTPISNYTLEAKGP